MSCETCPTCVELYRLRARNRAALRRVQKYSALPCDARPPALADLDEELKQTTAARTIIGYTIRTHRARQHARPAAA